MGGPGWRWGLQGQKRADLGQMEAPNPRPPGNLCGVKEHRVLICAGNGVIFQDLPSGHLRINHLDPTVHLSTTKQEPSREASNLAHLLLKSTQDMT